MKEKVNVDHNYNQESLTIKRALQQFQQERLLNTYSDLKDRPEFERIGRFFFEKLYAPADFTFRNKSIKLLRRAVGAVVYKDMAEAVSMVIELHDLSDRLDDEMVSRMQQASIGPNITLGQYCRIYRMLDNYDERLYQIDLSLRATRAFHRLSKLWIVGLSLKTVKAASHLMGMGKIMDFIYEGYEAFQHIDNIEDFLSIIQEREIAWHQKMWQDGETAAAPN